MREAMIKKWLDNILEAWEDYKELEVEEKLDNTVKRICKLYSKSELARALLILKPLEKPKKQCNKFTSNNLT